MTYLHKCSEQKAKALLEKTYVSEYLCCSTDDSSHLFWGDVLIIFHCTASPIASSPNDITYGGYIPFPHWDEYRFKLEDFYKSEIIGVFREGDPSCPFPDVFCNFGYSRQLGSW